MLARRGKPIFIVDIAVPRDVDEAAGRRIARGTVQEVHVEPVAGGLERLGVLVHACIDKHIAAHSGIADYIEKPINYERLFYRIKDIIGE